MVLQGLHVSASVYIVCVDWHALSFVCEFVKKSRYVDVYSHLLERSFSKDCFHLRHSSRVGLKIDEARLDITETFNQAYSDNKCKMRY